MGFQTAPWCVPIPDRPAVGMDGVAFDATKKVMGGDARGHFRGVAGADRVAVITQLPNHNRSHLGLVLALHAGMTLRQAFPLTDSFLAAMRRPIDISNLAPRVLEAELEALASFMDDAYGPLAVTPVELAHLVGARLAPVAKIELALALVCPSDLYLASIGAESSGLEDELLAARSDVDV